MVGLVEETPDLTVTTREVRTSVAGRNRLPKSRIKMAAKPSSKATGNNHAYERLFVLELESEVESKLESLFRVNVWRSFDDILMDVVIDVINLKDQV